MLCLEAVERLRIAEVPIHCCDLGEASTAIVEHAAQKGAPAYVVTPNAQHVLLFHQDQEFRQVYENADLSVADGMPLVWAAHLGPQRLRGRVNGTDLFETVCRASSHRGLGVFLFGGRPGSAEAAAEVLASRNPGLKIAGTYCPPMGFETDAEEVAKANEAILRAHPDIVFVGLGAPKQELWMHEHYRTLGVPVMIGIGGSFELVSGILPRAPKWMQTAGLEWAYRLGKEPRRLFKRYFVGNAFFVWAVFTSLL